MGRPGATGRQRTPSPARSARRSPHVAKVALLAAIVLFPALAHAQSIVGVVRDASGAVLPGVTVEAASPALIERVRTVVTDDQGQYKIVDLRPGVYTVTFTLAGFSTVKRESLELNTNFTATVNSDMGGVKYMSGAIPLLAVPLAWMPDTVASRLP